MCSASSPANSHKHNSVPDKWEGCFQVHIGSTESVYCLSEQLNTWSGHLVLKPCMKCDACKLLIFIVDLYLPVLESTLAECMGTLGVSFKTLIGDVCIGDCWFLLFEQLRGKWIKRKWYWRKAGSLSSGCRLRVNATSILSPSCSIIAHEIASWH